MFSQQICSALLKIAWKSALSYKTGDFSLVSNHLRPSNTVSHFSYAPFFIGPHFFTKMLESNILYDKLLIDILSV